MLAIAVALVAIASVAVTGCGSGTTTTQSEGTSITADQFSAFIESIRPGWTSLAKGHSTLAAANAAWESHDPSQSAVLTLRAAQLYNDAAAQWGTVKAPDGMTAYEPMVVAVGGLADIAWRKGRILEEFASGESSVGQTTNRLMKLQIATADEMAAYAATTDAWVTEYSTVGGDLRLKPPEWLVELTRQMTPATGG